MIFYHGTSDIFEMNSMIQPASTTGTLREDFRIRFLDKVFITFSIKSAECYAKKASSKFGGNPVVYEVIPKSYPIYNGGTEYMCNSAKIIRKL